MQNNKNNNKILSIKQYQYMGKNIIIKVDNEFKMIDKVEYIKKDEIK